MLRAGKPRATCAPKRPSIQGRRFGRVGYAKCAVLLLAASVASPLAAHPGGLNAEGCHNNRKTGDYHCHGQGSRADPAPAHRAFSQPRSASSGASYRSCKEARAAGATPIRRGQPGYGPHLDRDNDGIACE